MSIALAGVTAVNAAAGVKQLMDVAGQVMDKSAAAWDTLNPALTRHLSSTILTSRVYVDGNIALEDVTPNIARAAQTIYASLILNALQMDQMVDGIRPVKEMLKSVATENFSLAEDTAELFASYCGLEAADDSDKDKPKIAPATDEEMDLKYNRDSAQSRLPQLAKGQVLAPDSSGHFPMGRMVEVTLKNPIVPNSPTITINLLVQMFPYIVKPSLAPEFLKLNATPGMLQRWLQWRAGEIKFWRDFVFHVDLLEKKRNVFRSDTSGILYEYLSDQLKKDTKSIQALFKALTEAKPERSGRNIANSVMIFSEDTVMRVKADTGFDIHRASDRSRYFRQTYTMILYVVDPMYNKVTMYMNGVDAVGEYTFDDFKPKGKSNDVVDMLKAIQSMNQGRAPRF